MYMFPVNCNPLISVSAEDDRQEGKPAPPEQPQASSQDPFL